MVKNSISIRIFFSIPQMPFDRAHCGPALVSRFSSASRMSCIQALTLTGFLPAFDWPLREKQVPADLITGLTTAL
jgi:hypothetical protein